MKKISKTIVILLLVILSISILNVPVKAQTTILLATGRTYW